MKRVLYLVILCALLLSGNIRGQEVNVSAVFDTSAIFIGDQVGFSITVEQPEGLKIDLPHFRDTIIKSVEIISGPLVDTFRISNEMLRITEKYLVTVFDSGRYTIDPVFAEIKDQSGIRRFFSDYATIEVKRVNITPPDTTSAIFDIISPYRAPVTFGEIMPWLLIASVAVAILWLLIRFVSRRWRTRREIEAPVITDPAHVIAFRQLEKLREEKLWQAGETKKYYTCLTEILRNYLENRYGVSSMELTTSETLEALLKTGFKKDHLYDKLMSVLTGADLVKFAKYKPGPSENDLNFEDSWEFVDATKEAGTISVSGGAGMRKAEEVL